MEAPGDYPDFANCKPAAVAASDGIAGVDVVQVISNIDFHWLEREGIEGMAACIAVSGLHNNILFVS